MKLKSGKDLTQLEIMKRLNAMGIKYNSDIIGKNYYVNLYNEAIQSHSNLIKIKNELTKDKMYTDFYNQKFRKINECSLSFHNKNDIKSENNIENNKHCNLNSRKNKEKGFFSDYDATLFNKLIITQIAYNAVNLSGKYIDKAGNAISKLSIPIQAIKRYTLINIYPEAMKKIKEIMDILNNLNGDKFVFISLMFFFILIIIIFLLFRMWKKKDRK